MKIFLSNSAKYSICVKINSIEYFLEPNQTQQLFVNKNDELMLSIIDDNVSNSFGEKFKRTLKNLVLNVSCTYLIKNLDENDTIQITNEIFEFEENALLLPFAYYYLNATANGSQLQLVHCKADNVKTIKKIYFIFAFLGDGGFDFILNLFSITFQMHRIRKLCDDNKVFKVLKSNNL